MHTLVSWSGGKDACYALMKAVDAGYRPAALLNVMNETGQRSRSHGLPADVLQQQAAALQLPLHLIESSWQDYEQKFVAALHDLRIQYDLSSVVFGDIDLQEHRNWEEKVTAAAGMQAVLPLWQQPRTKLLPEMLDAGIEAMIVSCNSIMGPSFPGRLLSREMIPELEKLGVDPCGENGEYHSLVLNCPLFKQRVEYNIENRREHDGYWFLAT